MTTERLGLTLTDMPFVGTKRAKQLIKTEILPEVVGDICAIAYTPMVEKFLANSSWTTVHRIKKDVLDGTWHKVFILSRIDTIPMHLRNETEVAVGLAWDVFWGFYGLPYERKKKKMNGGVLNKEH